MVHVDTSTTLIVELTQTNLSLDITLVSEQLIVLQEIIVQHPTVVTTIVQLILSLVDVREY